MQQIKLERRLAAACRRAMAAVAFVVAAVELAAPAWAQADYPNRPVQIIIAYGAGTIGDVSMRILADRCIQPGRVMEVLEGYQAAVAA